MARARRVGGQAVVDGEHGALVLEHDAQRLAVEVAGRRGGDLLDVGDVALRLRLDVTIEPSGAIDLQAVRADVGGAVQRDHAAPVLERAAGHERHQAEPLRSARRARSRKALRDDARRRGAGRSARWCRRCRRAARPRAAPRRRRRGTRPARSRPLMISRPCLGTALLRALARRTAYPIARAREPTKVVAAVKFRTRACRYPGVREMTDLPDNHQTVRCRAGSRATCAPTRTSSRCSSASSRTATCTRARSPSSPPRCCRSSPTP